MFHVSGFPRKPPASEWPGASRGGGPCPLTSCCVSTLGSRGFLPVAPGLSQRPAQGGVSLPVAPLTHLELEGGLRGGAARWSEKAGRTRAFPAPVSSVASVPPGAPRGCGLGTVTARPIPGTRGLGGATAPHSSTQR